MPGQSPCFLGERHPPSTLDRYFQHTRQAAPYCDYNRPVCGSKSRRSKGSLPQILKSQRWPSACAMPRDQSENFENACLLPRRCRHSQTRARRPTTLRSARSPRGAEICLVRPKTSVPSSTCLHSSVSRLYVSPRALR
jgi:hypothetical protein